MSLKNTVTPPGIDPGTVRLIAQRLNHYSTPGHSLDLADRILLQDCQFSLSLKFFSRDYS
jgi:hypothetical protein